MELTPGTTVHGFAIDKREELPEIDGTAYVGHHNASGARLLYLSNDDNNKSFAIGFRTPPQDDTGVFHILEHSVLCGSRRFPVKEPFVDLLKGSMQTFLNAMTFGDKTLYPVASTNDQDLFNLMDVYLDAVFHPNIYRKRQIFEQEGWHYELHAISDGNADPAELSADETALIHNGVVFNEMKGALSDANSVLYDEIQAALLPDTCYAFESGGKPRAIPTLTYEEYLDEHRRHYRTDNSYIILYGNLDIDRTLAFLDERYLAPVAEEQKTADAERQAAGLELLRPRGISMQAPVKAGYRRHAMDTAPENACAACGYVIGNSSDRVRAIAVEILLDALFGSNEAPMKRALLDAGIAHDVTAYVSDALAQPFAIVQVSMPVGNGGERLAQAIDQAMRNLLETGLDKNLVKAALSHEEFEMREHDMGYADGVIYSMMALASWLYDDDAATDYLRYERAFSQLREALEGDYFERLCTELFLENDHTAHVEIVPTPGQSDDDEAKRLAAMNRALQPEERKLIVYGEKLLRELQEAPDTPEAIATLPRLTTADIGPAPDEPAYGPCDGTPVTCLRHRVSTRGISYAYRYFTMDDISFEDLPYVSVLALVLGKLDTSKHSAAELDTLVQGKLGNLSFYTTMREDAEDATVAQPAFAVGASALHDNVDWLAGLPREIMMETDFSDTSRILDLMKQRKINAEQLFVNAGHSCATARLKSYYSKAGVIHEQLDNVGFYRFVCDLVENFDERREELPARLRDVASRLFRDDNCTICFAGDDECFGSFWKAEPQCGRSGNTGQHRLEVPDPIVRNEAFIVPSDVCYAAVGWDRRLLGEPHNGSWAVAARALSLDYLWNEVRVKGGAYGVGFQENRKGGLRFHSYRDPHLDETLTRFKQASSWLEAFDPSQEDLEGFIVATVAKIDAPIKPRTLIRRQAGDYFTGFTPRDRAEHRAQVIATDASAIRSLSGTLSRAVDAGAMCVFGNCDILAASKAGFELVPLVG